MPYAAGAPVKAVFWVRPSAGGMLDKPQWMPYAGWAPVEAVCWVSPSGSGMLHEPQCKPYSGWDPVEAVCWLSSSGNGMLDEPQGKRYPGQAQVDSVCWMSPTGRFMLYEPHLKLYTVRATKVSTSRSHVPDEPHCKKYKQNDSTLPIIQRLSSKPQSKPKPNELLQFVPRSWQYWMQHMCNATIADIL